MRVQLLLELAAHRQSQHRFAQMQRLGHQREARSGNHRSGRGQIREESVEAEWPKCKVALLPFPSRAIDEKSFAREFPEHSHERLKLLSEVNEDVPLVAWLRVEHRMPQDGRKQQRAIVFDIAKKERGHEGDIRFGHKGADHRLGDERVLSQWRRAGILHVPHAMLVIDAHQRQVAVRGNVGGQRFEITQHDVRLKTVKNRFLELTKLGDATGQRLEIFDRRLQFADPILDRDDVQSRHVEHVEIVLEIPETAIIAHAENLVPLCPEMRHHLPRPGGMPGSTAGNAIDNFCHLCYAPRFTGARPVMKEICLGKPPVTFGRLGGGCHGPHWLRGGF